MEGPTPVSALIHAATMVTAGVYLIVRTSFIFELSETA
jgi:NADH-quinone oxidoreductase subunit L